jgi:NADH:ubiquinone oxidoreductase subunit
VFAGLDKITGRTVSFEVAVDETVQFTTPRRSGKALAARRAVMRLKTQSLPAGSSAAPEAYRPRGSQLSYGQRPAATGDYVPWVPGE